MGKRQLVSKRTIARFHENKWDDTEDTIAVEFPVTVTLNGEEFATIVCTPADFEDLTIGFLASEGVIRSPKEIESLLVDDSKGFVHVETKVKQQISRDFYMKRMIGSCCGKSRHFYYQNDARTAKTVTSDWTLSVSQGLFLIDELEKESFFFQKTGGVHNAALCSEEGIVAIRTDIGRHNALDKLYGNCLKEGIGTRNKAVAFSGRISSEVLLKISKIGTGILLSKSAPTDLALELADELNITVAGFVRDGAMNVYTHPWRIRQPTLTE
ncbi:MAG TPA: formate dehydrogenase accessory sulfurtransferase FdhD [Bacillales bacterium]|nr:formate dehydrogenase accessory sulfurtransferase FdhD [Bacillales bacterium]